MVSHTIRSGPVVAALIGNAVVAAIKAAVAFVSGSSAMFSEAVHSFADTANQALLLIGLKRSRKKADKGFGYGYGRERFFWALISACGIFFVGAGVTVYHGIAVLLHPAPIQIDTALFLVLFASFCIELWTLFIALRSLIKMFPDASWSERFSDADPATLAVCLEDGVAVIGVIIAAVSVVTSYYTGNVLWDALGSIVIGCLLGGIAILLIIKNRSYLIGRAIPEELKDEIIELLVADPAIEKVIDFKSAVLDIGVYRIKCEIEMNGPALLKEAYQHASLKDEFDKVHGDFEEFKRFCVNYADRIPRLIGKHIDKVEAKLMRKFPAVRHIDIEIN